MGLAAPSSVCAECYGTRVRLSLYIALDGLCHDAAAIPSSPLGLRARPGVRNEKVSNNTPMRLALSLLKTTDLCDDQFRTYAEAQLGLV